MIRIAAVLATFPTVPTVAGVLSLAVVVGGVAWVFIVKGYAGALDASQTTVAILEKARSVEKEALTAERAKWELEVAALREKVIALEATVASLRGEIVRDLLAAAKTALVAEAALTAERVIAERAMTVQKAKTREAARRARR